MVISNDVAEWDLPCAYNDVLRGYLQLLLASSHSIWVRRAERSVLQTCSWCREVEVCMYLTLIQQLSQVIRKPWQISVFQDPLYNPERNKDNGGSVSLLVEPSCICFVNQANHHSPCNLLSTSTCWRFVPAWGNKCWVWLLAQNLDSDVLEGHNESASAEKSLFSVITVCSVSKDLAFSWELPTNGKGAGKTLAFYGSKMLFIFVLAFCGHFLSLCWSFSLIRISLTKWGGFSWCSASSTAGIGRWDIWVTIKGYDHRMILFRLEKAFKLTESLTKAGKQDFTGCELCPI